MAQLLSLEVVYVERCSFCGHSRCITKEEYEERKGKECPCPACNGNAQWNQGLDRRTR